MKYDDNPTWRMLEKGKMQLRELLDEIPRLHRYRDVIAEAHRSIIKLQLEVENNLLKNS